MGAVAVDRLDVTPGRHGCAGRPATYYLLLATCYLLRFTYYSLLTNLEVTDVQVEQLHIVTLVG